MGWIRECRYLPLLPVGPAERRFQNFGFLRFSVEGDEQSWCSLAGDAPPLAGDGWVGIFSTPFVGLCGRDASEPRLLRLLWSTRFGELLCAGDAPCKERSPLSLFIVNDVDDRLDRVLTGDEPEEPSPIATRRLLTVEELGARGVLRDPPVDDGEGRVGEWD